MQIREMSKAECRRMLVRTKLARVACSCGDQPYVVPVFVAYDEASGCLYGFTTPGQKVEWMRANPLVCVEVDEVTDDDQWVSVIGTGHYEELPDTATGADTHGPQHDSRHRPCADEECEVEVNEQERAWLLLKSIHPRWWEPGCTAWASRVHRDPAAPLTFVYYRIRLDRITGHQAIPDVRAEIPRPAPDSPAGKWSWLRGLARAFG